MRLVLDAPAAAAAEPALVADGGAPAPEPGRALVRMEYGGLNRIDRLLCEGRIPRPEGAHVLGAQGAGRVVSAEAAGLEPGRLVAVYPYGGCGACERCATGNETLCREARLDGVNAPGMFQTHYAPLVRDAYPVPPSVSAPMACTASVVVVAWHVLVCRGGLREGETVAISSITSGLGACCGALAALLGARVVGIARRASLDRLRVRPAWLEELWASDGGSRGARPPRVDLGVDMVGTPTLAVTHRLIRTGGRLVTVGAHAGAEPALDLWRLFTREQDLRGSHGCHRADMAHAIGALERLDENDLVDSVFDLADHRAAYERLETPGRFGNVLLKLSD